MSYKDRCTGGTCTVWVAFVGDSQLRGPFDQMVRQMMGPNHSETALNHTDRRICCNLQRTDEFGSRALPRLHCVSTYGFDTASYARNYLRESIANNKHPSRLCITYQWNQYAGASLRDVVTNYTGIHAGGRVRPHDAVLAPQMIVVNPGLHPIFKGQSANDYVEDIKLLLSHMRNLASTQKEMALVSTRFVFHDITAVVDQDLNAFKVARLNQTRALQFNVALNVCLQDALRIGGSGEWLRVLPAQRLTYMGIHHGLVRPRGDGVHYVGGYDNVVSQLDLYFMKVSAASRFCRP